MFKTLLALMILAPIAATADDDWVPPSHFEAEWSAAIESVLPGYSLRQCGVQNTMAGRAVIVQCAWIGPDGRDIGYITQSLDGSHLCGWGERPEALVDDWVMSLSGRVLEAASWLPTCPSPVRWDLAAP